MRWLLEKILRTPHRRAVAVGILGAAVAFVTVRGVIHWIAPVFERPPGETSQGEGSGEPIAAQAVAFRGQDFVARSGAFGVFLLQRGEDARNQDVCEAAFGGMSWASEAGYPADQLRVTYWLDRNPPPTVATSPYLAERVERGAREARRCQACHAFEADAGHKVGPNLWEVVGRPIAAQPGFDYSAALSDRRGTQWTYARLDRYLTNPRAWAPGTLSAFRGLRNRGKRGDLILYLREQSDDPWRLPVTIRTYPDRSCPQRLESYDFERAERMMKRLDMLGVRGPVFMAQGGDEVLVLDVSGFMPEDIDRAVRLWKAEITNNPDVWNDGINLAVVREHLRNFFRRYGAGIARVVIDFRAQASE